MIIAGGLAKSVVNAPVITGTIAKILSGYGATLKVIAYNFIHHGPNYGRYR